MSGEDKTKPTDPRYSGSSPSGDLYLDAEDDSTWLWVIGAGPAYVGGWHRMAPADFYRASSQAKH